MYLIDTTTLELRSFLGTIPHYVILSHTWDDDEVTFESMQNPDTLKKSSNGYRKIKRCCKQAKKDGYKWAWIDTCCIDKRSSAELSEAINSMYRYYWEADKCYAYLSDVWVENAANMTGSISTYNATERLPVPVENSPEASHRRPNRSEALPFPGSPWQTSFLSPEDIGRRLTGSRWFRRGWTLQELLAPAAVEFYDANWTLLGTKSNLATEIGEITDINVRYLRDRTSIKTASLGLRLSWASRRRTTRDEDIAYCLLGLVGVNMPLLYGEGKRAFRRLQVELLKQARDHTMFLWSTNEDRQEWPTSVPYSRRIQSFLAPSPEYFQASDLENTRPTFLQPLVESSVLEMTALGLHITLPCIPGLTPEYVIAVLDCTKEDNTGIGITLVELDDGRYRRPEYTALQKLSPDEIKQAVMKELYILDEPLEEQDNKRNSWCAFTAESLTMEGISESDVRGYMLESCLGPNQKPYLSIRKLKKAHAFCDKIADLPLGEAMIFTIKLRSVDVIIFCGDFDGHCWLKVVLSDHRLARRETTELTQEFFHGPRSKHPQDYATASRGTELRVDVHARRKLLSTRGDNVVPCWQLAIHIRASSAMRLR